MKKHILKKALSSLLVCTFLLACLPAATAGKTTTFVEPAELKVYSEFLPDPFQFIDGSKVTNAQQWTERSEEIKALAQFYEYGIMPDTSGEQVTFSLGEWTVDAASKTQSARLTINVKNGDKTARPFTATVYEPTEELGLTGPYSSIVVLGWSMFAATARPVAAAGYEVIILDTAGVAADNATKAGAFGDLYPYDQSGVGTICAWAWGASRVLDALEKGAVPKADPTKTAICGMSRYGKASLACGLYDTRWDVIHLASSGSGGAGTYRVASDLEDNVYPIPPWPEVQTNGGIDSPGNAIVHNPGRPAETTEIMRDLQGRFGYWFCDRYNQITKEFSNPKYLPYDHHELIAACAPNAVLITFGINDWWCNHEAMYVGYYEASRVYDFLGISNKLGIRPRDGGHYMANEDIQSLIEFCDYNFRGIENPAGFKTTPYTPDPAWDTIRAPGSPDEVSGLRGVRRLIDGQETIIPASIRAINSANKKILVDLIIDDVVVETKQAVDNYTTFAPIVVDADKSYSLKAYFEGDRANGMTTNLRVISLDAVDNDYIQPQAPGNLWGATVDVERDDQQARLNTGKPYNNGRYVLMFKTKAALAEVYSITLNGVPCTIQETDNDAVHKVGMTIVPAEPVSGPLVAEINGVTFPDLFPGYSFNFPSSVINDISGRSADVTSYMVTFDSCGGSNVKANVTGGIGSVPPTALGETFYQDVISGKAAVKPADPVKAGFEFTGWTLNGAAYDFKAPVTSDITLKANWKAVDVTAASDKPIYMVNETITVTVTAPLGTDRVALMNESGVGLAVNGGRQPSAVNADSKEFTLTFSLGSIGDRDLTVLVAGEGEAFVATDVKVAFNVNANAIAEASDGEISVTSAASSAAVGAVNAPMGFEVKTSTAVTRVVLFNEAGVGLASDPTAVYSDANGVRTWTITLSLGSSGDRALKVYAAGADRVLKDSGKTIAFTLK